MQLQTYAVFFAVVGITLAQPKLKTPWATKNGGPRLQKRQPAGDGICTIGNETSITAPQKNIFLGLTDLEAASVTSFLHSQSNLNLTAASNATR